MQKSYVIAYDVGTSSVKTAVVEQDGHVVSVATAPYALLMPRPGWAEQDPQAYWDAVCLSTKKALQQEGIAPADVRGLAFGTQWKGIIPLDDRDRVLHNNIIWLDSRAGKQAEELNGKVPGAALQADDYWPKVLWVKEELPEVYEKTKVFMEVNAFLRFKATSLKAVDLTNNFVTTANPELQAYYDKVRAAAGIDLDKFPPLVMTTDKVGCITAEAAEEIGLREGTPVFGGCGDIPAITIGSGRCTPEDVHIYLGSSGWLGIVSKRGTFPGVYQSFEKDKDIRLAGGLKACCMSFNWAIDQLYHAEKEIRKGGIFEFVNKEIDAIPAGSGNLLATPWYFGGFPPVAPNARTVFLNVSGMQDRRHMVHAVLEGICYELRWIAELYQMQTGKTIHSVRIVGGGANGDHWMQIMANVLRVPVEVPEQPSHAGAMGAAYCSFIGLGICSDFAEVKRRVRIAKTYLPQAQEVQTYEGLFEHYKRICPTLEPFFSALNK